MILNAVFVFGIVSKFSMVKIHINFLLEYVL